MEPKIVIHNVIATARFSHGIDLESVAKALPDVRYDPKVLPRIICRINGSTHVLIYRNGKMVCVGAKSEKDVLKAIRKVVRKLKDAGIIIRSNIREFIVQNIVATTNLGVSIDVEEAIYKLRGVMYEQFPGLIYRMEDPKITLNFRGDLRRKTSYRFTVHKIYIRFCKTNLH